MKRLLLVLILGGWAYALMADTLALKKDHPDTYVVKKGDTLWDISGTFLDNPWQWPEIWKINPQVEDPHWIYPGDVLSLVYVMENGVKQPRLVVTDRAPVKVSGDGKLEPRVRSAAIEAAIPAIPLEKISAFLTKSRVVGFEELNRAPNVIAGDSKHIIAGAGDKVYARGNFKEDDTVFGIYRAGDTYVDPVTEEVLGLQAIDIGSGRIGSLDADIATLILNETNEEIRINDRLFPSEEKKVVATFNPKAPNKEVSGFIIDVEGGVSQVGSLDIVAINLGERDELEVGDVLAIAQKGEVVKDRVKEELVQLPDVRAGLLIIFRTFEKMSFGLIVSANRPLSVGDKVKNP
jgi:hypothetical protein